MNFISRLITGVCLLLFAAKGQAQTICNANGNVVVFSNYDGGPLTINVDVNIPNLKIGVLSYEACTISLTGPFVNNVVNVQYIGFNASNNHCGFTIPTTTISGQPGSATTGITFYPTATLANPNGNSHMICGYDCDTLNYQGSCNTPDQTVHYFQTTMVGSLYSHRVQYGCWSGVYSLSAGGNCCIGSAACNLTVNAGANQTICQGQTAQLLATASQTGSAFSWTPAASLSNALIANPVASPTATTSYIVTATNGVCTAMDTVLVTVNPPPAVAFNGLPTHCLGSAPLQLTQGTPTGGIYSGTGVSGGAFNPATAGNFVLTYTVTGANGCTASDTANIVVNTSPSVALGSVPTLCESASSVILAGSPMGGAYSGQGVTGNSFSPMQAGPGTHAIVYAVTGANGCVGTDTVTAIVYPNPAVSINPIPAICEGSAPFALTGAAPTGGTWFGAQVSGGQFDPGVGIGNYTVGYAFMDGNGCTDSAAIVVQVVALPDTPSISLMGGGANPDSLHSTGPTGATFSWFLDGAPIADSSQQIAASQNGVYTVQAVVGNCSSAVSAPFTYSQSAVGEGLFANAIRLFPNPANQWVSLSWEGLPTADLRLRIVDAAGRAQHEQALEGKNGLTTLATQHWAKGVYVVQVLGARGVLAATRLVVQ